MKHWKLVLLALAVVIVVIPVEGLIELAWFVAMGTAVLLVVWFLDRLSERVAKRPGAHNLMKLHFGVTVAIALAMSAISPHLFLVALAVGAASFAVGGLLDRASDAVVAWMPRSSAWRIVVLSLTMGIGWYYLRHLFHLVAYWAYLVSLAVAGRQFHSPWNDWGLVFFPTGLLAVVSVSRFAFRRLAGESLAAILGPRCWFLGVFAWILGSGVALEAEEWVWAGHEFAHYAASSVLDFLPHAIDRWNLMESVTALSIVGVCILGLSGCFLGAHWFGDRSFFRGNGFLLFFLSGMIGLPASASAYGETTHCEWLTRDAAKLLNNLSAGAYSEIGRFATPRDSGLQKGTKDEDAGISRHHFSRPTDSSGLEPCPGDYCKDTRTWLEEANYFPNAIGAYKAGDKQLAFERLGHALHLATQDMWSPPHVFNDWHFEGENIETWLEEYPNIDSDLRRWGSEVRTYPADPDAAVMALLASATLTYKAVRVPGQLHLLGELPASGKLSAMFPEKYWQNISRLLVLDEFGGINLAFHIPYVGDCFELTGANGIPIFADDWWLTKKFVGEDDDHFYFELPQYAYPRSYNGITIPENQKADSPNKVSLAELWALGHTVAGVQIGERLLAKAQEASAGLMLQFAKAVDDLDPTFTLTDGNGKAVEEGGTITTDEVTVSAVDPVDAAKCPVPSGFYRIVVRNVGTGVDTIREFNGTPEADATYSGLVPGDYVAIVSDGLGWPSRRTPKLQAATPRVKDC